MKLNPKISIRHSAIEGKGLFARESFKKDEEAWISKGQKPVEEKIYTDDEFRRFTEWCLANGKQWDAVALGGGRHRAAIADRDNHPENYGNHSCDPNTGLDQAGRRVALRDIERDEELTIDYAQFSAKDWSMNCSCGAQCCSKVVKGNL